MEHPIRRWGPANIREQLKMLRKAHRQQAQIVILECMAVQPELQRICQEQIVQSEITVITNIRRDHMFELGETAGEIAQAFASTVPHNGSVYTADERAAQLMRPYCEQNGSRLFLCGSRETAGENKQIAVRVAGQLSISPEQAEQGIQTHYKKDFGAQWDYLLPGGRRFLKGRTAPIISLRSWRDCLTKLPADALLVGVGSIKGEGYQMIQTLEKERAAL